MSTKSHGEPRQLVGGHGPPTTDYANRFKYTVPRARS